MRVDTEEYARLDLRVHSFLAGVPLHDAWAVDLRGGGPGRTMADLHALISIERLTSANRAVTFLFWLRTQLGRAFGLDRMPRGTPASSFIHRLTKADREASLVEPGTSDGPFRVLYMRPGELVSEIQNSTVHAFSVFALAEHAEVYRLHWAIYVRPVGSLGRWYMRLIDPFRRLIIYPAVLRYIRAAWARAEWEAAA